MTKHGKTCGGNAPTFNVAQAQESGGYSESLSDQQSEKLSVTVSSDLSALVSFCSTVVSLRPQCPLICLPLIKLTMPHSGSSAHRHLEA